MSGADDLVAALLRAYVNPPVDDLVEHFHAMLVGEAPEGVLLVPAGALRVEPRGDVVGPAVADVGRLAALHASHFNKIAAADALAADAEAAEPPRLEPHELLAGPRGVGPVGRVEVRRQVVPVPCRQRLEPFDYQKITRGVLRRVSRRVGSSRNKKSPLPPLWIL